MSEPNPAGAPGLLDWMRENVDRIPKDMLWREAAVDQMCFFRDRVAPLFRPRGLPDRTTEERHNFCKVLGTHRSKSIDLPVYYVEAVAAKVVARDNFYGWNATVVASRDVYLPDYFRVDDGADYLFFEGMGDWKRGRYCDGVRREFSFCVPDSYTFFAIMWAVASQVGEV